MNDWFSTIHGDKSICLDDQSPRNPGQEISKFILRVSGQSMRGEHFTDGDVVLVDANARPKDGDIVLAYIVEEGQVVKRLRIVDGERLILESANPDFKSIVIDDPAHVIIRGVVKGRAGKI